MLDWHLASLDILAPFSEVLFDPGHRLLDCRHVRTKDALVAGHIGHDRCRFWHREGEVEAGAALFDLSDRFPVRQDPVQYAFEGILCHLASQTTTIRPLPSPRANLCRHFDRIIDILTEIVNAPRNR